MGIPTGTVRVHDAVNAAGFVGKHKEKDGGRAPLSRRKHAEVKQGGRNTVVS